MSVKDWYRDKFKIKVFTTASGARMPFEDRLVYSVLAFARKGLSKRRLAGITRLERSQTIPKALDGLTCKGLVECRDKRFYANEPPAGLFSIDPNRKVEHWRDRLNYFTMVVPTDTCPLTIRQIAVFFVMHTRNAADRPSLLAKWLGFSRSGVINMRRRLSRLGLLDVLKHPVRPDAEKLLWWEDGVKTKRRTLIRPDGTYTFREFDKAYAWLIARFRNQPQEWLILEDWEGYFRHIGQACEQAGYSFKQIDKLLEDTIVKQLNRFEPAGRFIRQLPKMIHDSERQTARNRASKTFHYSSSFGLLKLKVKDFVKATRRAAS